MPPVHCFVDFDLIDRIVGVSPYRHQARTGVVVLNQTMSRGLLSVAVFVQTTWMLSQNRTVPIRIVGVTLYAACPQPPNTRNELFAPLVNNQEIPCSFKAEPLLCKINRP